MEKCPVCMLTEFMLSFEKAKLLTTLKIAGAISKIREQNKARAAKLFYIKLA